WAHQLATAAVFTSPLQIYGAHPRQLLDHPAVEIIKGIPSVWDETIALPPCAIGELAAFARRRGDTWFLAVLNGPAERTVRIPLPFLGAGEYRALAARDRKDNAAAVRMEESAVRQDASLTLELRAGGGFIAMFTRK